MARLTERPGKETRAARIVLDDAGQILIPVDDAVTDGDGGSRFSLPSTFDSFQDREFRWYYISMMGQMGAMNMQMVIRPLLAFMLTGSYAVLGIIGLAAAFPMLVLAPFGGVVADRLPKRTVLQTGQFLSMLNAAVLVALIATGLMRIEWLVVSALAQGIVMALTMPARQAMIPEIVGLDRMMNAVALNMAGMNTVRLFAPALGGFIVGFFGYAWAFAAMTALYGLAILGLARMTWQPATAPGENGAGPLQVAVSSLRDIGEGLRYIRGDRVILLLLIIATTSSVFGMPYQFLLPAYVVDIFGGTATDAGMLMSISAVGALAGALVLASLPDRHRGLLLFLGTFILGVGLFAFAQTAFYWIAAAWIVVVGVGSTFRQGLAQGLLHANVENEYRGRVMAVFMMQMSIMQLSTFIVGVTAEFVGIRVAFAGLGAGLMLATFVFLVIAPSVRRLD